jgi:hypothetical protein
MAAYYISQLRTRTLGTDTYKALIDSGTGEIVAWVREGRADTVVAKMNA